MRGGVGFERRDQISSLDSVLVDPGIFWVLGKGFGQVASCLLAIGFPGLRIGFFSDFNCWPQWWPWFEVTIGESLYVLIPNLGMLKSWEPADAKVSYTDENQNDKMRSIRFYVASVP